MANIPILLSIPGGSSGEPAHAILQLRLFQQVVLLDLQWPEPAQQLEDAQADEEEHALFVKQVPPE